MILQVCEIEVYTSVLRPEVQRHRKQRAAKNTKRQGCGTMKNPRNVLKC